MNLSILGAMIRFLWLQNLHNIHFPPYNIKDDYLSYLRCCSPTKLAHTHSHDSTS